MFIFKITFFLVRDLNTYCFYKNKVQLSTYINMLYLQISFLIYFVSSYQCHFIDAVFLYSVSVEHFNFVLKFSIKIISISCNCNSKHLMSLANARRTRNSCLLLLGLYKINEYYTNNVLQRQGAKTNET